ncbi:MAG: multidrug efflux SMR transporter [Nitrospirae bacterium]|nr:multidrug efflux SMR transporter [Nitrospirota bacterium]
MHWIFILIAGVFEIGWVFSLKSTQGFTKFLPMISYAICGLGAAFFLSQAMKSLPMGTSYAVWVGIAIVGSNILGMVILGEPSTLPRITFILLITIGVIGLKLSSAG